MYQLVNKNLNQKIEQTERNQKSLLIIGKSGNLARRMNNMVKNSILENEVNNIGDYLITHKQVDIIFTLPKDRNTRIKFKPR